MNKNCTGFPMRWRSTQASMLAVFPTGQKYLLSSVAMPAACGGNALLLLLTIFPSSYQSLRELIIEYQVHHGCYRFLATRHFTKRVGASWDGRASHVPVMVVPGNILCGA